jgi:hypothetical protein
MLLDKVIADIARALSRVRDIDSFPPPEDTEPMTVGLRSDRNKTLVSLASVCLEKLGPEAGLWLYKSSLWILRAYLHSALLYKVPVDGTDVDLSFLDTSSLENSIKSLKNLIASPASVLLSKDAYQMFPFKGRSRRSLLRWLRTRLSQRKVGFVNTLLQLKRVADKVPDDFIDLNLNKHAARMSRREVYQSDELYHLVVRESDVLLRDFSWKLDLDRRVRDFSLRSCVGSSIRKGGTYGWWEKRLGTGLNYGLAGPIGQKRLVIEEGLKFPTYRELLEIGVPEPPFRRQVVAIPEPLKVRVITKHEPFESPLWADFQRTLMRYMAKFNWLLCGKDWQPVVFKTLAGPGRVIVSDDGSAATDSIHPDLTISCVLSKIPKQVRKLFEVCWTGLLEYQMQDGGFFVQQVNGQAMGDRRSFPILCLIHGAAKIAWFRKHGLEPRFFVNGDDGVASVPKELLEDYLSWMSQLWELNPPKTYVHERFLSFNSKMFDAIHGNEISIIRWNLIYRKHKYGGTLTDPRVWNKVLKDCPPGSELALWREFNSHWAKEMKRITKGNNWFLPCWVGGLGLEPPPGLKVRLTGAQRQVIAASLQLEFSTKRPPWATRVRVPRKSVQRRTIWPPSAPCLLSVGEAKPQPTLGSFKQWSDEDAYLRPRQIAWKDGRPLWKGALGEVPMLTLVPYVDAMDAYLGKTQDKSDSYPIEDEKHQQQEQRPATQPESVAERF